MPRNFYPRSPCGERPLKGYRPARTNKISIHALLAESDGNESGEDTNDSNFYPRSPCGERQPTSGILRFDPLISIHALLAESDQMAGVGRTAQRDFYPRSPCGERPYNLLCIYLIILPFLSTLSLRRATGCSYQPDGNFIISIHALLAESDGQHCRGGRSGVGISIHALLAESDTKDSTI